MLNPGGTSGEDLGVAAETAEEASPATVTRRTRRYFLYNGMRLADPNPEWDPRRVKEHYATQFPELLTGTVSLAESGIQTTETVTKQTWDLKSGPAAKPGEAAAGAAGKGNVYEFKRASGTKG